MSSNKIQIIISGNLTGFTHFYATQGVRDWYDESEINFDYRNLVTFLTQNGEKAYALSFASRVVAVSLVTRILDTSRRPGVLVVSVLLPRGKKVAAVTPSGANTALYDLLNALNSRFCERNLIGEELNPSLSVLRQDYYSDILSAYQLVPDAGQRKLNMDVASLKKGVGYVAAEERAMPAYLASPFRLSYEGYPHVFFAPNASANIDEPAEEEVRYQVRVTNTGEKLRGWVRSKDKIYPLEPKKWQLPIEKLDDYTYEEVLQGKAERVRAVERADGILDITYVFAPKTKEITFVFKTKDGEELPFDKVAPVRIIEENGTNYPLPSATYEFRGQEIYGKKSLESANYVFDSEPLDLSRCKSKCFMTVERKSHLSILFPAPYDLESKRITVTRKSTAQTFQDENVRTKYSRFVSGDRQEWTYKIEAEGYETLSGTFPPEGEVIRLNFKKRESPSSTGRGQGTVPTTRAGLQDTRQSASTELLPAHNNTEGNAVPIIHVTNGGQNGKKGKGNAWVGKLLPFLIALPVLALAVGLSIFLYRKNGNATGADGDAVSDDSTTTQIKKVTVQYMDLSRDKILPGEFNEGDSVPIILQCSYDKLATGSITVDESKEYGSQFTLTASKDCKDMVEFTAYFDSIPLGDPLKITFDSFKNDTTVTYSLNVNTSDLDLYRGMYALKANREKMKKSDELYKKYQKWDADQSVQGNPAFVCKITSLYDAVKPTADKIDLGKLAEVNITLDEIKIIEDQLKNQGKLKTARCPDNEEVSVEDRIAALRGAIETLKKGFVSNGQKGFRPSAKNLSEAQKTEISEVFGDEEKTIRVNNFLNSTSRQKEIASMQSLNSILEYIKNNLER